MMFQWRLLVGLMLLLSSTLMPPLHAAKGPASLPVTSLPYTVHTLDNGLTVVIYQVKGSRQVVLDTWFGVGSAYELPLYNGMSHFLEHVMFKSPVGTPSFDQQVEQYGGYTNAATSRDFTHYFYVVPHTQFKDALNLHLSMLFKPSFPTEAVQQEQAVVQEEIFRSQNAAFRPLFDAVYRTLYQNTPQIAQTIAGPAPQIATFDAQKVRAYYQHYYFPKSATLFIATPDEEASVLEGVNAFFKKSPVPMGSTIAPLHQRIDWQALTPKVTPIYASTVPMPTVLWAFPEPPVSASLKERFAFQIYLYLLANQEESALNEAVLHQAKNPAFAVGASWTRHAFEGFTYIYAMTALPNLELTTQRIQNILADETWLTEEKLERAKTVLRLGFTQERSQPTSYLSGLGEAWMQGTQNEWEQQLDLLKSLTLADLKAAQRGMQQRLQQKTLTFLLLPETDKGKPLPPVATSLLKSVPALPKPLTATSPPSSAYPLKEDPQPIKIGAFQGYQKVLPHAELIGMAWQWPVSALSPRLKKQLDVLGDLWMQAPLEQKSSRTVKNYLEDLGVSVQYTSQEDWVQVYFETTADQVPALIQAQRVVLQEMHALDFDEKAFESERDNAIQSVAMLASNPQALLFAHANRYLAKGLGAGVQLDEEVSLLKGMTWAELKTTWLNVWEKSPVAVVMAGSSTALKQLEDGLALTNLLEGHQALLPQTVTPSLNGQEKRSPTPTILQVDKADQSTAWLLWGWTLPSVQAEDMAALQLIQTYLGQGMSAQLFQEVREKRGLAYEVTATMETTINRSMMTWYAGVKPENLEKTKAIFQSILTQLASQPLSQKDLDALVVKRLGRFDIALNTPEQWVAFTGRLLTQGLPLNYLDSYPKRLKSITPADVQRVAKRYLGTSPSLQLILSKPLAVEASPSKPEGRSHD
ncbi:MAG: insulinase family protein [Vampirovibrio sp.]